MTRKISDAIFNNGNNNLGIDSRLFWEENASEYTPPFEEKALTRTKRIIDLMERKGLPLKGARVLDVGSGPGTFALPLTLRGASVTALDISDNMLKRLVAEAQHRSISSVKTIRASWKEIDPADVGFPRAFDIVLTALSSAIETDKDILKMEQCSRQWCVYIATGKIRRRAICNKIRRILGLPLNPRPDIRDIRKKLEQMSRAFLYESFSTVIREKKTIQQLVDDIGRSLEALGKVPNQRQILTTVSSVLKGLEQDGVIDCERQGDTGLLMWRVDEN